MVDGFERMVLNVTNIIIFFQNNAFVTFFHDKIKIISQLTGPEVSGPLGKFQILQF